MSDDDHGAVATRATRPLHSIPHAWRSGSPLTPRAVPLQQIPLMFKQAPGLSALHIDRSEVLTLSALAACVTQLGPAVAAAVTSLSVTLEPDTWFTRVFALLPGLQELHLFIPSIDEDVAPTKTVPAVVTQQLRLLSLAGTRRWVPWLAVLVADGVDMTRLTLLDMSYVQLSARVAVLTQYLPRMPALRTLMLQQCGLSLADVQRIVRVCGALDGPSAGKPLLLTDLIIAGNWFSRGGAEGAAALMTLLNEALPTLVTIDMRGCWPDAVDEHVIALLSCPAGASRDLNLAGYGRRPLGAIAPSRFASDLRGCGASVLCRQGSFPGLTRLAVGGVLRDDVAISLPNLRVLDLQDVMMSPQQVYALVTPGRFPALRELWLQLVTGPLQALPPFSSVWPDLRVLCLSGVELPSYAMQSRVYLRDWLTLTIASLPLLTELHLAFCQLDLSSTLVAVLTAVLRGPRYLHELHIHGNPGFLQDVWKEASVVVPQLSALRALSLGGFGESFHSFDPTARLRFFRVISACQDLQMLQLPDQMDSANQYRVLDKSAIHWECHCARVGAPAASGLLVLLGDAMVGKTSVRHALQMQNRTGLARLLRGNAPAAIRHEDRTIVLETDGWTAVRRLDDVDIRLNITIWDFGGQDAYHALHQVFLGADAMHVLVLDPLKGVDETGKRRAADAAAIDDASACLAANHVSYWTRSIASSAAGAKVFVVATRRDIALASWSAQRILRHEVALRNAVAATFQRQSLPPPLGFAWVACQGRGAVKETMPVLTSLLLDVMLTSLPSMTRRVPQKWLVLRQVVEETLRRGGDESRIQRVGDVARVGDDQLFETQQQADEAIEFLANIGVVVRLDSLVVLDVPWLLRLLRPLMHHESPVPHSHARVALATVAAVWHQAAKLSPEAVQQVLEMMQRAGLAFVLPQQQHVFFPALLPPLRVADAGAAVAPALFPPVSHASDETVRSIEFPEYLPLGWFQTLVLIATQAAGVAVQIAGDSVLLLRAHAMQHTALAILHAKVVTIIVRGVRPNILMRRIFAWLQLLHRRFPGAMPIVRTASGTPLLTWYRRHSTDSSGSGSGSASRGRRSRRGFVDLPNILLHTVGKHDDDGGDNDVTAAAGTVLAQLPDNTPFWQRRDLVRLLSHMPGVIRERAVACILDALNQMDDPSGTHDHDATPSYEDGDGAAAPPLVWNPPPGFPGHTCVLSDVSQVTTTSVATAPRGTDLVVVAEAPLLVLEELAPLSERAEAFPRLTGADSLDIVFGRLGALSIALVISGSAQAAVQQTGPRRGIVAVGTATTLFPRVIRQGDVVVSSDDPLGALLLVGMAHRNWFVTHPDAGTSIVVTTGLVHDGAVDGDVATIDKLSQRYVACEEGGRVAVAHCHIPWAVVKGVVPPHLHAGDVRGAWACRNAVLALKAVVFAD